LDVAADPIERLSVAGKHQRIAFFCCCCCCCCCCCWCCWCCWSCGCSVCCSCCRADRDPSCVGSGTRWGRGGTTPAAPSSRLAADAGGASTQVSLDPPPWLELTTREPSTRATRDSPPGSTHTSSPSLTANGRRST